MSQARVYTTAKVRKDWTCGKCGAAIRKGIDGRLSFAVGFRGYEQTRCLKPECRPTRGELESSAVAPVYDAIDGASFEGIDSVEDAKDILGEVRDAISEVVDEYESNEMFEINEDLQDRVNTLQAAADELDGWDFDGEEDPGEDEECETCGGTGTVEVQVAGSDVPNEEDCEDCGGTGYLNESETSRDDWLQQVRDAAADALDSLELP